MANTERKVLLFTVPTRFCGWLKIDGGENCARAGSAPSRQTTNPSNRNQQKRFMAIVLCDFFNGRFGPGSM